MGFPQDGLASHIASPAGGWVPQLQSSGVLQITLPPGVQSGDLNTLMLATKATSMPARNLEKATIPFLAGYSNVLTKPAAPPDFTLSVHDYVDILVYDALHEWSQLAFDQRTGFMGAPSAYKTNGFFLLFGPAAQGQTPSIIRRWELIGVAPLTQIPARSLDYDNNNPALLEYSFAVDDYQYVGRRS
jgi:hypothetical protein